MIHHNSIQIHKKTEPTFIYRNNDLFYRDHIIIKTPDQQSYKFKLKYENAAFKASLGNFASYTEHLSLQDDAIIGKICLTVYTDQPFIVQCPCRFIKPDQPPYFMIPGFLYGTNNLATSDGQQPKFNYGGPVDWPNSSLFYVRADRSTHPGLICIRDGTGMLVGIKQVMTDESGGPVQRQPESEWAPAYLYNGLMLDTHDPDTDMIGFQLGYENAPARYSWVREPWVPKHNEYLFGWIEGQSGKTLQTQTVYAAAAAEQIPDYGKLLRTYYTVLHEPPVQRSGRNEALRKISRAICDYSWDADKKGFVLVDGENTGADIAWTGGMQVAFPLLKTAKKTGDSHAKKIALQFIDNMCRTALNEKAGLLHEEYRDGAWQVTGWWGVREDCFNFGDQPLHSAYLNGQAVYYLLKSCELETHPDWLRTARTVLDTAVRSQRSDGALAVFFDPETGDGIDYDGFQPCWFVPALVLLYKFTNEKRYLHAAENALEHYHAYHLNGELYNTPMDTHRAVDQEGNLAFIIACVECHKLTGQSVYLDLAMQGLSWEFSWKFACNTVYSAEPLRSMNWSSCGGSITSTYNPSIHPMGNLIAGELYYLYQQTGSEYIRSRLKDTCVWGLGIYNTRDNEFGFGRTGQATEQFTYTDGLVLPWPGPWDGGIWKASLSWASACVLLSCAEDIPDEFFLKEH